METIFDYVLEQLYLEEKYAIRKVFKFKRGEDRLIRAKQTAAKRLHDAEWERVEKARSIKRMHNDKTSHGVTATPQDMAYKRTRLAVAKKETDKKVKRQKKLVRRLEKL